MPDDTPKWTPNPDQLKLLEALHAEAKKERNNKYFADRYTEWSSEKLSKIFAVLDGRKSYFDEIQHPENLMEEIAELLKKISTRRMRDAQLSALSFHKLESHELVIKAIRQCENKSNENRLVTYLAPTGGGKSYICKRLEREIGSRTVHTRLAWRKNYTAFLRDVCSAIGLNLGNECRADIIENLMEQYLLLNPMVLAIDEAEYFGSVSLSGIKRLLNKTHITILICAIPEVYANWTIWYRTEADQLKRRQHVIIRQNAISIEDATLFFSSNRFTNFEKCMQRICGAASQFGHFTFLQILAEFLDDKRVITEDDIKVAIGKAGRRLSQSIQDEKEEE